MTLVLDRDEHQFVLERADRRRRGFGNRFVAVRAHFRFRLGSRAMAAATLLAVGLVLVLAMCARFFLEQRLPVGDGDLVVVGMDLGEREETVAVPAVVDEGGLERGLHARHLGQIYIAA